MTLYTVSCVLSGKVISNLILYISLSQFTEYDIITLSG